MTAEEKKDHTDNQEAIPARDRILRAAFSFFIDEGYAGTSMLKIATRARVSKRELYTLFGSKQAILAACIRARAQTIRGPLDLPPARDCKSLTDTLLAFGTAVLREVSTPVVIAVYRLAIAEAKHSPEVAETLNGDRRANRHAFAGLLAQAQAAGILTEGDPEEMMEQFIALLWGDLMLTLLLGTADPSTSAEIDHRVRTATDAFLKLYVRIA